MTKQELEEIYVEAKRRAERPSYNGPAARVEESEPPGWLLAGIAFGGICTTLVVLLFLAAFGTL